MPKPLLNPQKEREGKQQPLLSASKEQIKSKPSAQMSKLEQDRLLRKTRSKEYMEAMQKLDTGGHVHNKSAVQDIMDALAKEFPEINLPDILLGIVAPCYLGDPYEVHSVDIAGNITTHYKSGQPMPGSLEKVRGMVMNGGYILVEVYTDCCRAVSANGTVSVVPL